MQTIAVEPRTKSNRYGVLTPPLEELRELVATRPNLTTAPLVREIVADLETPVSAYLKLWNGGPAFLLESIEGGERLARYSFIGANPRAMLTLDPGTASVKTDAGTTTLDTSDPLQALAELLAPFQSAESMGEPRPRFMGGAVGYFSYETIRAFEPRVGQARGAGLGLPLGKFMLVDSLLVFDHISRTIKVVAHVELNGARGLEAAYADAAHRIDECVAQLRGPLPAVPRGSAPLDGSPSDRSQPNTTRERYHANVERAREYIRAGDIFQVVLSQRVDVPTSAHPFTIYRALRTINPSPYMFYLDFVDHQVVGASPELLVRLEDGMIANHPIAGTRPRGKSPAEDDVNGVDLLGDAKERAEHIMLVDLGRNDIGRVARPGTVHVPRLMEVEKYSHVMHIVSNVEGELDEGLTGLDALRACFPAGTVSGAPKVRAMEIIAELEIDQRGPYAGAAGYFDFSGGMDTAIALRTVVVKDGVVSLQAGGGIVADSTPEGEFQESMHKMRGPLNAIELAEEMEQSHV